MLPRLYMLNSYILIAQRRVDLFTRLDEFGASGGIGLLLLVIIGLLALFWALNASRKKLLFLYCVCLMFSGHLVGLIDSGSTLLRWLLILCLAISVNRGYRDPGVVCKMLGAYWIFCLFTILWSLNPLQGVQLSVLSILVTVPMAMTISDELTLSSELEIFPKYLNLCSAIYILNALWLISDIRGQRYSGVISSAGLFVITGGILMPSLLWGILSARNYLSRNLHLLAFTLVFGLGLLSGQRTGFFAGLIGCLPLLLRFVSQKFLYLVLAIFATAAIGLVVLQYFPEQAEFIEMRYFEKGFTSREDSWNKSLELILQDPFLGFGAGSHSRTGFGMHNAFLQEWYNGGLMALFLFAGAFVYGLVRASKMSFDPMLPPQELDLVRLCLGLMLTLSATAFFESKLASPSNILAFTTINVGLILHQIEIRYYANRGMAQSS